MEAVTEGQRYLAGVFGRLDDAVARGDEKAAAVERGNLQEVLLGAAIMECGFAPSNPTSRRET